MKYLRQFYPLIILMFLGLICVSVIAEQNQENKEPVKSYEVSGDRQGQVTVKDRISQRVIRTFQMPPGVVREVFLLDDGKIVGASQQNRAIFWNLGTGQEISQFPQRIYGFSHDETQFFTYAPGKLLVYNYPKLILKCELKNLDMIGPEKFVFSPDDRFLAVLLATGRPENDENYPGTGPLRRSIRNSKLFDISNCQEIQEFSKLMIFQLGKFSDNSQFYDLKEYPLYVESENRYVTAAWRFALKTKKLQKL